MNEFRTSPAVTTLLTSNLANFTFAVWTKCNTDLSCFSRFYVVFKCMDLRFVCVCVREFFIFNLLNILFRSFYIS